jgi:cellulose synthase/poly-beta-1,6-N-acetylglucosamine synthase-like glycosyltransferase
MISFIVPAHNEQACLGDTLQAIRKAMRGVGKLYEIVVANDASTDATAEIAQENNARVINVNHRQIAATRNSGARAAQGERLFFVDADTIVNRRVVTSALRCLDEGAVGGGAPARFDGAAPLYAHFLMLWFGCWLRLAGIAGGAFLFCTRDAFEAVGGFDERLFGAEDAKMSWELKREGRFVVLWRWIVTSGRRVQGIRGLQMVSALVGMGFFPKMLRQRSSVKKIWYDSNREEGRRIPDLLLTQGANAFLLMVTVVLLTDPFFDHFAQLKTLIGSLWGNIRFAVNILLCHVLLVLWPCAGFLLRSLFQQTRWLERVKVVGLTVLSVWFAWNVTSAVIWFWPWLYQKLI